MAEIEVSFFCLEAKAVEAYFNGREVPPMVVYWQANRRSESTRSPQDALVRGEQ
jgi:hypothetical protein